MKDKNLLGPNGFPYPQPSSLDMALDDWIEKSKTEEPEATVFDPIVCSNYSTGKHMLVITPEGQIRFASQYFTEAVLKHAAEEAMKYAHVFQDVNTFEMYAFEYPDTVRRIRKQVGIITNREAKFTETRLDFRSPKLPKYHPMNSVMISHMYSFHVYVAAIESRVQIGRRMTESPNWQSLYTEYSNLLAELKENMPKRQDEFLKKTKTWIVWELTTLPWGNQFDDIFDRDLTARTKATLPKDSGFFVK